MHKPKELIQPVAVPQHVAAQMLGLSGVRELRRIPRELLGHYSQGRFEMYRVADLEAYTAHLRDQAATADAG